MLSVRSSLVSEPSPRRTSKLGQLWKRKAAIRIKSVDFHDVGKRLSREGQAIRSAKGLWTGLRLKFAFSQHDELRSPNTFSPGRSVTSSARKARTLVPVMRSGLTPG